MLALYILCRRQSLVALQVTTMSYRGEGRQNSWKRPRGGGGWGRGRRFSNNNGEGQDGDGDGGRWHRGGGRRGGGRRGRGEYEDSGGGRGGRERPPPGLSGREIGMWYAKRSMAKKEKETTAVVNLEGNMERKIRNLLDDINTADNIQPQPSRSGASLDEDISVPAGRPSTSYDGGHSQHTFKRPNTASGFSQSHRSTGACFDSDRGQGSQKHSGVKVTSGRDGHRTVSYDAWNDTDTDQMETSASGYSSSGEEMGDEDQLLESDMEDYDEVNEMPIYESVTQCSVEEKAYIFGGERSGDPQVHAGIPSNPSLDAFLSKEAEHRQTDKNFIKMMDFRKKLPSYDKRQEMLKALKSHQCLVIKGETGCGKTTQVPQYILDDFISQGKGSQCKVICTQPRRISAVSVAERVADERGQNVGCDGDIGYSIRLERKLPRSSGSVLYCTTGILLKYLEFDPYLRQASHIVVDEIHERDLLSDFLLIILKDLLPKRPELKVILMSATLNAEQFSNYFHDCPMLDIPGFTYPVTEYWLEDAIEMTSYEPKEGSRKKRPSHFNRKKAEEQQRESEEMSSWVKTLDTAKYSRATQRALVNMEMEDVDIELIHQVIHHICFKMDGDGAILVFVPGMTEIKNLNTSLVSTPAFNNSNFRIIPLHSLMPTVNQREVFERPPPGVRKIIIATNIAETSITIDDVVFVVDSGKIKISGYQPENNLATLSTEWVSKANARQRRGRAGRVQEGVCFHLYSSLKEELLDDYQLPDILRTPLEELCLQIKLLKLGKIESFISKAMQQPSPEAVHTALTTLQDLKALDEEENLLPLGHHLARMRVDPKSGKMILFGAMFGCLDPICTIAASLGFRNAFIIPMGKEAEADHVKFMLSEGSQSDHIMLAKAFKGWERAKKQGSASKYCWDHFLSSSVLKQLDGMKKQFAELLYDRKFIRTRNSTDPSVNINSDNENLIKAITCAGLYPNVAKLASNFARKPIPQHKPVKFHLKGDRGKVYLHPGSVNNKNKDFNSAWFIYHKKMKTAQVNLFDTSLVSPYPLLFFGGEIGTSEGNIDGEVRTKVTVDNWISFWANQSTAQMVKDLRQQLDRILEEKIKQPGVTNWSKNSREGAVMCAIIELITTEEVVNYSAHKDQQRRSQQYQEQRSYHNR
ncbi:ATP-dependent DNA/RNA helicase DHX36-like [Ylistrum balloti]|uniref:ATP-dependent DNA/RNA helicase DHX36-like n=1 Tax=Ylistrum balloti TaxID=509963 RepID=UPI002905E589|nr:ATP-dependent DNA/RNA helicase DHX36-like [Ylistrum balloti]